MSPSNPPSNLVLCIDGTGNDQINGPSFKDTNVAKISHLISNWHHPRAPNSEKRVQSVLYQQGVGTTSSLTSAPLANLQKTFDQLFATREGIAKMVAVNYTYISANYRKLDKLFIFGFSRGAYVARLTASLVADIGAFKFSSLETSGAEIAKLDLHQCVASIVRTWISSAGDKSLLSKGLAPFAGAFIPAEVDFLGVYDTVASINAPDIHGTEWQSKRFKFAEEVAHRGNIKRAYHAVAISEHRGNFKPVMWKDWPVGGTRTPQQIISQVWFPGYHTSAAGGSKQAGVTISAVGLVWMLSKCEDILGIDEGRLEEYLYKTVTQVPAEEINDSCKGIYANAGDYFRTCMGSGAGEARHVVCEKGKWEVYTGIREMPNMKGGEGPGEGMDCERLGVDEVNGFEERYLGMVAEWRRGGGLGGQGYKGGLTNPASFLGASARVDAPKGQVATNMADVVLGKGRRGEGGDGGHGHEGGSGGNVKGQEDEVVDSSGGDDALKPKKKSLWRSVKRRFSLKGKGSAN